MNRLPPRIAIFIASMRALPGGFSPSKHQGVQADATDFGNVYHSRWRILLEHVGHEVVEDVNALVVAAFKGSR